MARPRKDAAVDFSIPHNLTVGLIERAVCPPGLGQVFLRDSAGSGHAVRVTKGGAKSFIFEGKLRRQTVRCTIGSTDTWTIADARTQARRLQILLDNGDDPRQIAQDKAAADAVRRAAAEQAAAAAKQAEVMVRQVWDAYLAERKPFWSELHYRDHVDKAKPGGLPSGARGGGKQLTKPGPLAPLMPLRLKDLTADTIERWAAREAKTRAASARLAAALLGVFLNWCTEQPQYAGLLPSKNPARTRRTREALGKPALRHDVLQREQLRDWFAAVQKIPNQTIAAALQMMLLTGARRNEVLSLKWSDVNTRWRGINMHDKVEGEREIPLTPYVATLLQGLPRRTGTPGQKAAIPPGESNPWVFSSPTSKTGRLSEPNTPHSRACRAAGVGELTLHGLRRSFASLCEWIEVPAGISAQIQGHAPQGARETHYIRRPLDLLRLHHDKIEAWILKEAGIVFDPKAEPAKLQIVAA